MAHTACSFTFLTQVATDHGQHAIGTLQVGTKVLAYNPKTHTMEQEPVLHVWVHSDNDLIDLTITTATKGQHGTPTPTTSEVVHTNQKHPFLTIEKGFLPVGQIVLGMHVRRADGKIGVITGWKVVPGVKTMYNLEVAQDHTFTVGDGQWVVHNCAQFNQHIIDEHLEIDNTTASVKALKRGNTEHGVWNSQDTGEAFINDVINNASQGSWMKQPKEGYSLEIQAENVPGRVISATGRPLSVGGVRIVMTGPGSGDLMTAFPVSTAYFPSQ